MPHHPRMVRTIISSEPDFDSMPGESLPEAPAPPSEPESLPEAPAPSSEPKLFIANLAYSVTDEDLGGMFGEFGGVIEAHHVNDKFDPNMKRGFGFVTMDSVESAQAAIDALHATDVSGRDLQVVFATPKGARTEERAPREPRERRERMPRRDDTEGRKLYVGNLDYATTNETLEEIFTEFGKVEFAAHLEERDFPGRRRGFGFVTFSDASDAEAAARELDGLEVDGRSIKVNMAQKRT